MKTFHSFLKSALFIGLFVIEFFILKSGSGKLINIVSYGLLVADIIMWLCLLFSKKTDIFRVFIIKIFRSIATSAVGMLSLIYFAFHLNWLAESIFNMYVNSQYSVNTVLLYFSFMILPFLLITFFIRKEVKEVKDEDRKILFSSLSLLDQKRKADTELSHMEKDKLNLMKNNHFNKWPVTSFVQWQPIFKAIEKLGQIQEVVLFYTNETQYLNDAIKKDTTYSTCDIESLLRKYFPDIIVNFQKIDDPNNIQSTIDDINFSVKKKSKKFTDKQMVFSITGGTAVVSGAMTALSLLGLRGIVYAHQQKLEIINTPIDVFDVRELWEEIANQYE